MSWSRESNEIILLRNVAWCAPPIVPDCLRGDYKDYYLMRQSFHEGEGCPFARLTQVPHDSQTPLGAAGI